MNKAFFYSNVCNDPRLKTKTVLTFRGAVNSRAFNTDTQAWEDSADYFDFVLYGKRAEAVAKFLKKGMPVTLECHAKQNTWQDKDGNNRSRVEFVVDSIDVHYLKKQAESIPENRAVA